MIRAGTMVHLPDVLKAMENATGKLPPGPECSGELP